MSRGKANGYARRPGSGPVGETCKGCRHYCRVNHNGKIWRKCAILKWRWTHGAGTDIKASSPACEMWEKPIPEKSPAPMEGP